MSSLILILSAIALLWVLAYAGASLPITTIAIAAWVGGFYAAGWLGTVGLIIGATVLVPLILLSIVPLRRSALTGKFILPGFRAVLPEMNSTEREALEAGDTWWEGEMFRGKPKWDTLLNEYKVTELKADEQAFLDNQTNELCRMIDDWNIMNDTKDLPPEVWKYIRENGFFSMLISKEWGGLGFSAYAQSCVVTKIATRSISTAVSVMVPNSLGPGELLSHYGTEEQKQEWLPGLADGTHIPCFGLTGPEAGSDASAIPDNGIIEKGMHNGKEVLGIRLNFAKRYITLAPVSTCVGLAFKLYDPNNLYSDEKELGITVALIPADHPGVEIGRRHYPLACPFMNGPINGEDIFMPLDFIIGGPEMAGKGWRMLVECLSTGRGISLPALAAAAGKVAYRQTGAYARIRRQFKMPIGKFEGVEEAMGRIGGMAYILEASRSLTASSVDMGAKPSVVTAIAKYHMTEMMRTVIDDAMDIHGGRGIQLGPRNYLGLAYHAVPVAITVEGANILTRNLMIFGQGAIRCHPHVFPEMEAARDTDEARGLVDFDREFLGHIGFSINRGARAFTLGLTNGLLAGSPKSGPTAKYFRQLTRMSSSLAICSDMSMGILGGDLKRKERISARLGDVLSHLYLASTVLKYYFDRGEQEADWPYVEWAMKHHLNEIYEAFEGCFANFPKRWAGRLMRVLVFPTGRPSLYKGNSDANEQVISGSMMEPSQLRDDLSFPAYLNNDPQDSIGRMETTFDKLVATEGLYNKYYRAAAKGVVTGFTFEERLAACVEQGILTADEAKEVDEYNTMRYDALLTDAFTYEELHNIGAKPASEEQAA